MMMRLLLAAVALSVAACAPTAAQPGPPTSGPAQSTTAAPTTVVDSPAPTTTVIAPTPTITVTPTTETTVPAPVTTTVVPQPTGVTKNVQVTFYAGFDNDPPGSLAIDDPLIHFAPGSTTVGQAGGTGTYADPLTFASPVDKKGGNAYGHGGKIYVPEVQKYFLREDSCGVSWTAVNGCGDLSHVDLYMGNPSGKKAVLDCEDALTPNNKGNIGPIVVDPPSNLPVDPTPLWSDTTGTCGHLH